MAVIMGLEPVAE